MTLSAAQRRFLCAKAHGLSPVVQVGQSGITSSLCSAIEQALFDHELIKVKFGQSYPGTPRDDAAKLADSVKAQLCQCLGRVVTLYKARGQEVKGKTSISLPSS